MPSSLSEIVAAFLRGLGSLAVSGIQGGARGLLVARIARELKSQPILLLAADEGRAAELADDCAVFLHPDDARRVRLFPEEAVPPYSPISPEPRVQAERMRSLHELLIFAPTIVVASVQAVMRRVPPKGFILSSRRIIRPGERMDPIELAKFLTSLGYEDVPLAEDEGSFARRGGIVDVWPPTSELPVRIELDGDMVGPLRLFDPATQRSTGDASEAVLIPARGFPFDAAAREAAARRIRGRCEERDIPAREWREAMEALREGVAFPGIEAFMPLFHGSTASLLDYLPPSACALIFEADEAETAAESHWSEISRRSEEARGPARAIAPEEIAVPPGALFERLSAFRHMRLSALQAGAQESRRHLTAAVSGNADIRPLIESHRKDEDMLSPLAGRIREWQGDGIKVLLTCHTGLQAERLSDLFHNHGMRVVPLDGPFEAIFETSSDAMRLKIGRLSSGFCWPAERIAVLTDEEIFGRKIPKRARAARPLEAFTSFMEIAPGDLVVHEQHGIGRHAGLAHLAIQGSEGDFLVIEYMGGDKLYLPVYRLNLIGRYIADGQAAHLDKLGGFRWARARGKVGSAVRSMARELIAIHAAREAFPGFPFPMEGAEYEEFSAAFPYDETPDQAQAIDDVMRDMEKTRPMDRLICGDVGYGKTEVAMRAAHRAAMAGKQVAVLVPTTVLALQHFVTFSKRFAGTPASVEMLSRFKGASEIASVIEGLKRGGVDIVIGTHRLLQGDVRFRDLGLLIIDEEHRFGVRHKERMKRLKETVDVMALTATPIPRTLSLSLSGIREISVINTPPADRHSIATYVVPYDDGVIRGAILREMERGGQVFFVHNRVETMEAMRARLARLVPEARMVVGHGQMRERDLERVMIAFIERRADVLLSTAIIESGLDIPTANTIIINRADTFGLAELYQLRGRVGRSNVRASAYLITPEGGEMNPTAKRRLQVLQRFTELGSGFQIAMHDLEFRGSGNILGKAQSGHIAAVGYEMYAKLLDRAVRRLKGSPIEEECDPEIALEVRAFLPEGYVADTGARIEIYRRLAGSDGTDEIAAIGLELADRFGPLPPEAVKLLAVMEIKILARNLRIKHLTHDGSSLICRMEAATPFDPKWLLRLEGTMPGIRAAPPDRLLLPAEGADEEGLLAAVKNSLSTLLAYVSANS